MWSWYQSVRQLDVARADQVLHPAVVAAAGQHAVQVRGAPRRHRRHPGHLLTALRARVVGERVGHRALGLAEVDGGHRYVAGQVVLPGDPQRPAADRLDRRPRVDALVRPHRHRRQFRVQGDVGGAHAHGQLVVVAALAGPEHRRYPQRVPELGQHQPGGRRLGRAGGGYGRGPRPGEGGDRGGHRGQAGDGAVAEHGTPVRSGKVDSFGMCRFHAGKLGTSAHVVLEFGCRFPANPVPLVFGTPPSAAPPPSRCPG